MKKLLVFIATAMLLTSCMSAGKMMNRAQTLTPGDSKEKIVSVMGHKPKRTQVLGEYEAWQYRGDAAVYDMYCVIWLKDGKYYKTTTYNGFMSFRYLQLTDMNE